MAVRFTSPSPLRKALANNHFLNLHLLVISRLYRQGDFLLTSCLQTLDAMLTVEDIGVKHRTLNYGHQLDNHSFQGE